MKRYKHSSLFENEILNDLVVIIFEFNIIIEGLIPAYEIFKILVNHHATTNFF